MRSTVNRIRIPSDCVSATTGAANKALAEANGTSTRHDDQISFQNASMLWRSRFLADTVRENTQRQGTSLSLKCNQSANSAGSLSQRGTLANLIWGNPLKFAT